LSALLGHQQQDSSSSKGQDEAGTTAAAAHYKAGEKELEEEGTEEGDGAEGAWQASSAHVEKLR